MNTKRHGLLLAIILVFGWHSSLYAQNQYNVKQFRRETGEYFRQPGRWGGNDWLKLGLIAAGSVLIMQVDQPIRDAVLRDERRHFFIVPIEAGRIWGEWYTSPLVAGAFGLHGWLADNPSSSKVGFELVQAVAYSELLSEGLKIAIGRARPYENEGAFSFHPFSLAGVGFQSLPGGHNTSGWAMSTVLSRNAHSRVLKILAYVPASLTFISRVYQDQHWTSDDFLGAAIGIVVGTWVVNLHERNDSAMRVSALYPFTVSIRF